MFPGALEDRSERLAALVDGLGAALRAGGVPEAAASRVLESASAAVLDALTLDLTFVSNRPVGVTARRAEALAAGPALPLAA